MKSIVKTFCQPAFLICVVVLALAGGGKSFVIRQLGVQLTKLSLPLQKSLELMDPDELAPYKRLKKSVIDNKDILEELGTKEYLQWILEDTEADKSSSTSICSLFITYYTGNPDKVPHIPDECFVGAGNQRLARENIKINVAGLAKTENHANTEQVPQTNGIKEINARYVVFTGGNSNIWTSSVKFARLYFFKANGQYAGSRGETRKIMGQNFFGKYSYFCKVEWQFYGYGLTGRIDPTKDETIEASERFLSVLLPVLERDYWPDWDKANSKK